MTTEMSPIVFNKNVQTVDRSASVREAIKQMTLQRVSSVVVVDGERPIGIFTERDAVRRVLHEGVAPDTTRIEEVMTAELLTIGPETRIADAISQMSSGRLRHLPVVEEGRLVGMVSVGDLAHEVNRHNEHLIGYITGGYR